MNESSVELRRFPRLGRKVGLYVVLAALSIAALVLAVAYRQGMLQQHVYVYLHAPDATGIVKGMPVKFLGFSVGSVSGLQMRRAMVEIELMITADHAAFVPHGSHARLSRDGLIGASFIEIVPNREAGGRSIAEHDVLRFERPLAPAELAEDLKRRVDPVIAGFKQMVDWINSPEGDVRQSLAVSRQLIEAVGRSQEQVETFMRHANASAGSVRESVATIGTTLSEFARTSSKTVGDELPRIASSTTTTMHEVAAAARELNQAARAVGGRLNETSDQVRDAVSDAQGVMAEAGEIAQAVKRSWPFSRVLEAPRTRTLSIDINDSPLPWPGPGDAPRKRSE